jgi:hypothetical protein
VFVLFVYIVYLDLVLAFASDVLRR